MRAEAGRALRRIAEAVVCGVAAAGLHLAALTLWVPVPGGAPAERGAVAAVAVGTADAGVRALVEAWQTAPAVDAAAPAVPTPLDRAAPAVPVRSAPALPVIAPPAPAAPSLDRAADLPATAGAAPPDARVPVAPPPARPSPPPSTPAAASPGGAGTAASAGDAAPTAAEAETARLGYGASIRAAIARRQNYPAVARDRGIAGAATLRVRVARDGRLMDVRVAGSSGSQALDAASLDAARAAAPFAPAPADAPGAVFTFQIRLVYVLR